MSQMEILTDHYLSHMGWCLCLHFLSQWKEGCILLRNKFLTWRWRWRLRFPQQCHMTVWPWASHFSSGHFGVLICNTEKALFHIFQGCRECCEWQLSLLSGNALVQSQPFPWVTWTQWLVHNSIPSPWKKSHLKLDNPSFRVSYEATWGFLSLPKPFCCRYWS